TDRERGFGNSFTDFRRRAPASAEKGDAPTALRASRGPRRGRRAQECKAAVAAKRTTILRPAIRPTAWPLPVCHSRCECGRARAIRSRHRCPPETRIGDSLLAFPSTNRGHPSGKEVAVRAVQQVKRSPFFFAVRLRDERLRRIEWE